MKSQAVLGICKTFGVFFEMYMQVLRFRRDQLLTLAKQNRSAGLLDSKADRLKIGCSCVVLATTCPSSPRHSDATNSKVLLHQNSLIISDLVP